MHHIYILYGSKGGRATPSGTVFLTSLNTISALDLVVDNHTDLAQRT